MEADGANPRRLTNGLGRRGVLPFGHRMADTSPSRPTATAARSIYVIEADGSNQRRLTGGRGGERVLPFGHRMADTIAFASGGEIYVIELQAESDDHSNTRSGATSLSLGLGSSLLGRITPGSDYSDVDSFSVQVGESGTLIVYTTGSLDTQGTLEDSLGSILTSNDDGGEGSNFYIAHSVSAGTYYLKVESGSRTGIYTISAFFSSPAARLTDHWADDRFPSWSPDGQHIAFHVRPRRQLGHLRDGSRWEQPNAA